MPQHLAVHPLDVIAQRHRIDRIDIQRGDHRLRAHVAEQRDLAPLAVRDRPVAAAQQHLRLDADVQQLLHRVLRRLGLELARRRNERHQCQVNEHRPLRPDFVAELTNGLQERQAFDVAHRAADLHQHEIEVGGFPDDHLLDGVGDVRDHLHRGAQIVAATLLGDHVGVDAPGGGVVGLVGRHAGETLVVAEVQVGLRPVVGDEYLPVLIRAHGPGIDVQIRVELAQPHGKPTRLQQRTECGRSDALAQRGDHAAGDEYEPRHGRSV